MDGDSFEKSKRSTFNERRYMIFCEQKVLKENVGCQDQIAAAYGGFNKIEFYGEDSFKVSPIIISEDRLNKLQNNLLLFFTGISRFASEIFSVASNMLGHAITAKTAKLDKKLKMIDLQMKKMRLDQQQQALDSRDPEGMAAAQTAHGVVLSRNDLLERIIGKGQNTQKE